MKHNDKCIVCFDGKISRGVWGKVLSSTQYKFTAEFPAFGKTELITFRKETRTHKRFIYGVHEGIYVVIPMNQLKSWYKDYYITINDNTVEHMTAEGWD